MISLLLPFSLGLGLIGCTPRLAPPGPGPTQPQISADSFTSADGQTLVLQSWLPGEAPRAVVIALHGFNDYAQAFATSGPYWAGQGLAVYAYDQRGFGRNEHAGLWAGTDALTTDLSSLITLLRDQYEGRPIYVLGESMGGAVALAEATRPGLARPDGLILAAPAVWSRDTMPLLQRVALFMSSYSIPWAAFSGSGLEIQASDNIDMLRALGQDPLVIKETRVDAIHGLADLMDEAQASAEEITLPALVLYGEKDEVVPAEPTFAFWQRLRDSTQQRPALYADGWHMLLRDLQAEVVWRDITAWIEGPHQPLPSGADRRAQEILAGLDGES